MTAAVDPHRADQPLRRENRGAKAAKLRDGVMKRGRTWSYVIRVKDPETGVSKPRWVGGFATEEATKAARDEARVKARQGEYIDHNQITVTAYLDDWIDSHSMKIKPRTLLDYRACIRLYVTPRIGHMPIQAVRPSTITKLYRDPPGPRRPTWQATGHHDRDSPACGATESIP
jgi:Phage integrase, N-terminal SAM-like domain